MPALTPTLISNGATLNPSYQIVGIDVINEVNRIPNAEITLIDGSLPQQTFKLSEEGFFDLGKEVEIKLRYEGNDDATLFKGLVVKQSIQASIRGSLLTVALKDPAIKATLLRKSTIHRELSDTEIISNLVDVQGLSAGEIVDTQSVHTEILQYNCTDWDFLILRAESQGLLVTLDGGVLSARFPSLDAGPKQRYEYGGNHIHSFDIQADALNNVQNIKTENWDIANQELSEVDAASDLSLQQGDYDFDQLAQSFGTQDQDLHDPVPLLPEEAQAWVDGKLNRSRLARFRGRLSVSGLADIKPLDLVEVGGMGKRFNGKALVSGVRHRVTVNEGWITDLQLGLSDKAFSREAEITDVPAAGLLPEVNGLRLGVIADFEDDPDGELRLKVTLPSVGEGADAIWARLATPDAGNGRGFSFRPEIGDEVIVGFINNDSRQAVVLGSLFSSAQPPFDDWGELTEDNFKKGIATKTGSKIEFTDEDKPKLRIETASANSILLDEDAESIEITDQHGNAIIMNADGITITSSKDFKIEASGDVEIAGSKVDIK